MKRIRSAYGNRFRQLLAPLHPRKMEKALEWFTCCAEQLSERTGILLPVAFHRIHASTQLKIQDYVQRRTKRGVFPAEPVFWCDAGLGGLARWLRAAGYEAHWEYGIDDADLLRRAASMKAVVLTTDSGMMERGILRDGHLRSLWLPPALHIPEQLAAVFSEFHLQCRTSRCPDCGGHLLEANKEQIKDEIPPKTYLWLDQFWRCERCSKIFWNGTHWRKIQAALETIGAVGG